MEGVEMYLADHDNFSESDFKEGTKKVEDTQRTEERPQEEVKVLKRFDYKGQKEWIRQNFTPSSVPNQWRKEQKQRIDRNYNKVNKRSTQKGQKASWNWQQNSWRLYGQWKNATVVFTNRADPSVFSQQPKMPTKTVTFFEPQPLSPQETETTTPQPRPLLPQETETNLEPQPLLPNETETFFQPYSTYDPPSCNQSISMETEKPNTPQMEQAVAINTDTLQQDTLQPVKPTPRFPSHTIYIKNLNERIKIAELKKSLEFVFSRFGHILEIIAHKNLRMRGQAFVVFLDISAAVNALRAMHGISFYGKTMIMGFSVKDSNVITKLKGTFVGHKISACYVPFAPQTLFLSSLPEETNQVSLKICCSSENFS